MADEEDTSEKAFDVIAKVFAWIALALFGIIAAVALVTLVSKFIICIADARNKRKKKTTPATHKLRGISVPRTAPTTTASVSGQASSGRLNRQETSPEINPPPPAYDTSNPTFKYHR